MLNTPALTRAVSALSFSKTDGGAVLAAVEEGQEHLGYEVVNDNNDGDGEDDGSKGGAGGSELPALCR